MARIAIPRKPSKAGTIGIPDAALRVLPGSMKRSGEDHRGGLDVAAREVAAEHLDGVADLDIARGDVDHVEQVGGIRAGAPEHPHEKSAQENAHDRAWTHRPRL